MKRYLFLFAILLQGFTQSAYSRLRLSESRQSSEKFYIYTVTQENFRKICLTDHDIDENVLGELLGEYDRTQSLPELPRGNYLIVTSEKNKLNLSSHTVDNLNFQILPSADFMLTLSDSTGNPINDAMVKKGLFPLKYDPLLKAYTGKAISDNQIIEINNRGVLHLIHINETELNKPQTSFTAQALSKAGSFFVDIKDRGINMVRNLTGKSATEYSNPKSQAIGFDASSTHCYYTANEKRFDHLETTLNWNKWRDAMALDTIEYYLFLYPDHHYSLTERSRNNKTLIAPYVVNQGNILEVQLLWIDSKLHYSKNATGLNPYVFEITPGIHDLRFRTSEYDITVTGVEVKKGGKNIFSFNLDSQPSAEGRVGVPAITVRQVNKAQRGYFSDEEIDLINESLIAIRKEQGTMKLPATQIELPLAQWIEAGGRYYDLNGTDSVMLIGPFPQRYQMGRLTDIAKIYEADSLLVNFGIEGNMEYHLLPNYTNAKSRKGHIISKRMIAEKTPIDFRSEPISKESIKRNSNDRLLTILESTAGLISANPQHKGDTTYNAELELKHACPALIWIKSTDSIQYEGLFYGNTRTFEVLPSANIQITLLYRDTSSLSAEFILQPNGKNILTFDNANLTANDEQSEIVFGIFESLLEKKHAVNPYLSDEQIIMPLLHDTIIPDFGR